MATVSIQVQCPVLWLQFELIPENSADSASITFSLLFRRWRPRTRWEGCKYCGDGLLECGADKV